MNLGRNSGKSFKLLKTLPDPLPRNCFSLVIYKNLGNIFPFCKKGADFFKVEFQFFKGTSAKRNQSFLITFSVNQNNLFIKMNICKQKTAGFTDSKSAGINQFKQG